MGLLFACLIPRSAPAEETAVAAAGTLGDVVNEIRLLRQAIERQSASTARAQVLIGRLSLQDQRTARARDAVTRLEGELATNDGERDELLLAARQVQRLLEDTTDPQQRSELEAQSQAMRARYKKVQQAVSSVEERLARAREALEVETGRYDELDRLLADLDRRLESGR